MQNFSDADSARIRALLTEPRLTSYVSSTDNLDEAVSLYEWNVAASSAVLAVTGLVEIFVRNAMCEALDSRAVARGETSWFHSVPLDDRGQSDIAKAIARAEWAPGAEPGRVIAELSFGFWRYLAASRYHASLWVPSLHRAFPHGGKDLRARRELVERDLKTMLFVRNRAAHHEPIHRRDLLKDEHVAQRLLTAIDPIAASWALRQSRISEIVQLKPH